ncbi:hypothetical protein C7B76_06420 [filamentous cyanobacterium CCP2]|nr:hypothetical protein C7B76_06420 [filamentous cyanobacterium CCP2]
MPPLSRFYRFLHSLTARCRMAVHGHTFPRSLRLALSVILGFGIAVLCWTNQVKAAETVLLQYRDLRLSVSLAEFQTFAADGNASPALQDFLQQTEEDPEAVRQWLTTEISPGFSSVLPQEFILLQISKTLGEPLEREDLGALGTALRAAFENDQAFSVMEVLEQYPGPNVRLTLNRLEQAYTDINLVVTRLEPVLNVAKQLLPELVCDCDRADSASSPLPSPELSSQKATLNQPKASIAYTQAQAALHPLFSPETRLASHSTVVAAQPNTTLAASATQPNLNQQLVFTFGPFRPSISIADLTTFVETGELSRGWRFYLNVANIDREELRRSLSQEVTVNAQFLDRMLNSVLGEYLLYEVGQIIQTPSGKANIQALRSAIILSSIDDNRFSTLELLQHYPTQQIQINGVRLARIGTNLSRIASPDGLSDAVSNLEGWLVQIQASTAEDVCNCENIPAIDATTLSEVPTISAATVSQFLPLGWQPVPSHRVDRGIIKVVWLTGTPYEMGYQHGQLLHDEIASIGDNVLQVARFAGEGFALGRLASKRSFPDIEEECRGLSDATKDLGITLDTCMMMAYADVYQELLGHTLPNELFWNGCNQFVATNEATISRRLYHGSSVDNSTPIPYVMNNPVIFVRQPTNGLPHIFVTYPGVVWPNSGMNVAGISLGLDTALPRDPDELSLYGRSNVQIMAQILETATQFEEARTLMETQPRVRANLIMIADGKSKQAGVFEFTGQNLGVRELQENGVLYTTNHFVLPEMYEKQPLPPDPSSISRFDRFQQLMEPGHRDSHYGQITPEVMATILRDRVNPYTGQASPKDLFDDDASPGGNGALRQAIFDPEGLRLWIAAGSAPVPENPFVCFSMGELLEFPNATPCESPEM